MGRKRRKKKNGKFKITYKDKDGFKKLPINLQSLESEIFIDGIFNQLHKKGITCFTKHDSVIVGESNKEAAEEIMNNYYKGLGFEPDFKVDKCRRVSEIEAELEKNYIDTTFYDYDFLVDIEDEQDIHNLDNDEISTLLENGHVLLTINEITDIEFEIYEANKYELTINDDTYITLYKLAIRIKDVISKQ